MALGIMLSVVFILAATLTLLPAVLAKLGPRVDRLSLPWVHSGEHRSARFAAWGERLWRRPVAFGAVAVVALVALSIPVLGLEDRHAVDQGRARGRRLARRPTPRCRSAFGPGAPGALQIVAPRRPGGPSGRRREGRRRRRAGHAAPMPGARRQRDAPGRSRRHDPSDKAVGTTIDRLRGDAAGRRARRRRRRGEPRPRDRRCPTKTPLVIGVVLALGFLLLLVALQAPILAAVGVVTNLLAVGAAFGVARLIFQEGNLAGLLGLEPQGFLNAWAPVFFFAMVFAISMDYTVFLLSSAKEHWDRSARRQGRDGRRPGPLGPRGVRRGGGDGRRVLHVRALRARCRRRRWA